MLRFWLLGEKFWFIGIRYRKKRRGVMVDLGREGI